MGQRSSKAKHSYDVAPGSIVKDLSNSEENIKNKKAMCEEKPDVAAPEPILHTAPVPKWITEAEFVHVLQKNVDGFAKIKNFSVKPALSVGENYATYMLRVKIETELVDNSTKHVSYMLKVPHDSLEMQQMLEVVNFFEIENSAYFDIIPKLEQLYKEKGIDICLGAKAFTFEEDKRNSAVLLEDLGQFGYKNANRLECLDEKHTECVLRKMAQFHAASAHYIATKGPFPEHCMKGLMTEDDPQGKAIIGAMIGSSQKMFLANLKSYKNGEKYYQKFERIFEKAIQVFFNETDKSKFNVLNHGDSWSNNILFKYDEAGNILDTIFVDYQLPKYGTPAQDLLYFIVSSVNIKIKLTKFEYFIRYYYDNLIEHLLALEYPHQLPTLSELHIQLFENGLWAVMTMTITMPAVLMESNKNATMENFMSDGEAALNFKNLMYSNKRYRMYVEELLPWLDNRGYLDAKAEQQSSETEIMPAVATLVTDSKATTSSDKSVTLVESTDDAK